MIEDLTEKRTQELLSLRSYYKGKMKGIEECLSDLEWKKANVTRELTALDHELRRRRE